MAEETFHFTSSTLRSLHLQQEQLEWEDRCRAAAQQHRSQRCLPSSQAPLARPHHSCRDPAVHNALFSGNLQQVQALFQDENAANMIVETVNNQLTWSPEQGFWVLTPKTRHTVPLTIAAALGYTDCSCHLIQQGAELDAWAGGAALHEACAHAQPDCVRLLLTFGAKANVLSEEGATPLHLCTAPESLVELGVECEVIASLLAVHWLHFPRALEVLLNAYPCVPSCDTWVEAVLPELWQEHEAFYSSALGMVNQPRRLQHLARLAVRAQLGNHGRQAAACLPLPQLLRDYLLLCVEGSIQ
ncbi:LOW QUALITY PROTEIN: ankyrin repeat and SOCS box protein 16 [Rhynchonycteris naso]